MRSNVLRWAAARSLCGAAIAFVIATHAGEGVKLGKRGGLIRAAQAMAGPPQVDPLAHGNACLSCHDGIENIRRTDSGMIEAIVDVAVASGVSNTCVVCHGGDASVRAEPGVAPHSEGYVALAAKAHAGTPDYFRMHDGPKEFYPDPASPWVNKNTCGQCHKWEVRVQWQSMMMTEAGKIQGTAWGFGGLEGYKHGWGNYDVDTFQGDDVVGTPAHRAYLQDLAKREPQAFVDHMSELPAAPAGGADIAANPSNAAFTYLRSECQRCHLAVEGRHTRGDYRGMGCGACHMPYGVEGFYEGQDRAMQGAKAGRPLVHTIQGDRGAPVTVGKVTWTGIPVETCVTCHNRGRRIGVSYQGLMETAYTGAWSESGEASPSLHSKQYIKLHADVHADKGFFCQDCHTTLDIHSSGRLVGAISGAVEIECSDCHGTPGKFPWELPLGWMDEYDAQPAKGPARGVATNLPSYMSKGVHAPVEEGYLLSARGNPLGNAVRQADVVHVHLASGAVYELLPLKKLTLEKRLSEQGRVAMVTVEAHMQHMECYACHSTWAPQCYGCHVKVDYTKQCTEFDWTRLGHAHLSNGKTPANTKAAEGFRLDGLTTEQRSYLRWEDPPLAVNGEGRVSPVIPGCQTSVTVVNKDGKAVLTNHIFRIPNVEGAGPEGQLATDMAPLHPHTVQKRARTCESCHDDPKALGYGIGHGELLADPSKDYIIDLATGDGRIIPQKTSVQMFGVPNLQGDWSRFVTEDGKQVQTVGHHFRLDGPLSADQRARMSREGVCASCHKEIPKGSLAVSALHHAADMLGQLPKTNRQHTDLLHKVLLTAAWAQVGGGVMFGAFGLWIARRIWRRRKLVA